MITCIACTFKFRAVFYKTSSRNAELITRRKPYALCALKFVYLRFDCIGNLSFVGTTFTCIMCFLLCMALESYKQRACLHNIIFTRMLIIV